MLTVAKGMGLLLFSLITLPLILLSWANNPNLKKIPNNIINNATGLSGSDTSLATAQAIKTYVDTLVDAQDLDVTTDSGTIAIDLDDEVFTIGGTSNEIETSASGNVVTIGLPNSVSITTNLSVGGDLDVLDGKTSLSSTGGEAVSTTVGSVLGIYGRGAASPQVAIKTYNGDIGLKTLIVLAGLTFISIGIAFLIVGIKDIKEKLNGPGAWGGSWRAKPSGARLRI